MSVRGVWNSILKIEKVREEMTMERNGSWYGLVALFLFAVSLSGCAALNGPQAGTGNALEPPQAEEEVIGEALPRFLVTDEGTGIVVQYSVVKVVRQGEDLESPRTYTWIDPREEHVLEQFTELIFFRVEIFNPTGKEIFFEQRVSLDNFKDSLIYAGGNVENSVFNFPVPIQMIGKKNTMQVAIIFEDGKERAKEFVTENFVFLLPTEQK